METNPLVSVIIPTYNREAYLEQALESVAAQNYSPMEILVIDDGSEKPYAKELCDRYENCTYHFKENGGISSTRNYGIDNALGEYIAFLDDDDFWAPNKITLQIHAFEKNPEAMLVHCACLEVDENGEETGKTLGPAVGKEHLRSGNVFWNALGVWLIKSPTPLIKKEALTANLRFDEAMKAGEDQDFYQRFFYRYPIYYLNEPLAFYRVYESDARLSLKKELYQGIALRMFENFKQMGVSNPWVLHKIAKRLLRYAVFQWKRIHPEKSLKIPKFTAYFRPYYCLKTYFNS
ncbi:glycosyltransferase [Aureisphaera galaxeae]|uniref:glycosyltransferase family 2 protein n=1 Tax=Aureisphaera galaxeae TaxID=1538023 RepID=UPI0023509E25|nr:glycosyltransferase family 2 protein [Aureisphaera galaxeae]MDC8006292.1 glycosyltransferase [Aureisphaera galaxeae]